MKIEIEIRDRLYKEILEMCEHNSITIVDYILDCVEDNFNLMKYADLNKLYDKMNGVVEETEQKEEKVEETPKKKAGRPKKTATEDNVVVKKEESTEIVLKPKRIRTLATK